MGVVIACLILGCIIAYFLAAIIAGWLLILGALLASVFGVKAGLDRRKNL